MTFALKGRRSCIFYRVDFGKVLAIWVIVTIAGAVNLSVDGIGYKIVVFANSEWC